MANWVLGLTGGIGSGKSAISAMFEELSITVVDADIVAREVVLPGSQGLKQITAHFGENILTSEGTLDRAKLSSSFFFRMARMIPKRLLILALGGTLVVFSLCMCKSERSL